VKIETANGGPDYFFGNVLKVLVFSIEYEEFLSPFLHLYPFTENDTPH
jgi:hypothetical protein